mgnify:FL=1
MKSLKIGLDIHGVLDTNPFFKEMASLFVAAGHELHIITGARFNQRVRDKFERMGIEKGIHYTHFFSISEYLLEKNTDVRWQDPENPWFDENAWNTAKADYCREQGIDIHFDDTEVYSETFTTPFYLKK